MSTGFDGWVRTTLGEVCDVVRGITFPAAAKEDSKDESNVCCLRTSNIQRELKWGDVYFVPREYVRREDQLVRVGDVLMSLANSYELVGKVAIAEHIPHDTAFGAFLGAVRPRADVNGRYLFHFLRSEFAQRALREGSSQTTNIANISIKRLATIEIPIAPVSEQGRIADKLDALLARVDACRTRLDRVPVLLKRFRQAVLEAAISGALTQDWRESIDDPGRPGVWSQTTLGATCRPSRVITYGVIKLGEEMPDGVPCLRTSNVRWLWVDTNGIKRISAALSAEYNRTVLEGGEVLVNVRGTLGGVAVASNGMKGWNVSREVAVVPTDQAKVVPQYLAFWIAANRSQRWLAKVEKGVAYTGINIEDLRTLPVDLPPCSEQLEIVRRVESHFALADSLETKYEAARAHVERLTPALLAKAFRGELVPQDPNDEPADVMLARLRGEGANGKGADRALDKRGRGARSARPSNSPSAAMPAE